LAWNLLICIPPTLKFTIFLHNITYKSWTGIILSMFFLGLDLGLVSLISLLLLFGAAVKAQFGKKYWGSLTLNLEVYNLTFF